MFLVLRCYMIVCFKILVNFFILLQDIKEKIPYVALDYEKEVETAKSSSAIKSILRNKYTAAWMLDVSGSFSPCRRHFMLLKLKSARLKNMKNYNNYLNITDKFMELSTNSKIYLLSFVVLLEDQEVNKMMLFIGVM
ncbi:hypothetical protein IGI04_002118 [Brassica rapa subsp. trilocularis]|uniref:Uncharacterized protein n=1 Tax=Brassica rapa subsp. trilocularis TaxID=1813537 RepID=A0ABQ7NVG7_BRACM|nr:hypothetical protein IGI04_002118 [Brassica rapa subsp. trilocularis]